MEGRGPSGAVVRSTLYDGLTLAEWRERIKSLDLKSPSSAAAIPGLLAIVRDGDAPWVSRRQAAETLGRLGSIAPQGVPVLTALIDDPSESETSPRVWALKALSLYGPTARDATPRLVAVLRDRTRPLTERELALEAMAQVGPDHREVLPAIMVFLTPPGSRPAESTDDPGYEPLRELAVETFTLLGPRGAPAIPALLRMFDDPSDVLRMKVAQALGAMGGRGEIAVIPLAERMVLDGSALVRDAAADALARIGPEAVPALVHLLEDSSAETRGRAATALGQSRPPARGATDSLRQRLDDESPAVRIRAAEALWKIQQRPDDVIPVGVRTLAEPDRQIRIRGARLLAAMGERARPAIPLLQELTRDNRPEVRRAAKSVLDKLGGSSP